MTKHECDLFFSTLEFLRKEISQKFPSASDWKDIDDYIFSNLDFTIGDLDNIYCGRDAVVYAGSAIEGFAPRCPTYYELYPFYHFHSQFEVGKIDSGGIGIIVSSDVSKPVVLTNGDSPVLTQVYDRGKPYDITLEPGTLGLNNELTFWATEKDTGMRTKLHSVQRSGFQGMKG